jgi:ribosomal protein L7/L12
VQVKLDLMLKHLGLEDEYKSALEARIRELARRGRKIEAIRMARVLDPAMTLKDAKAYVERLP